jgi:hypothetical protein
MTPCYGLGVHKPIQELQSVKGPANTFDQNPKWARTLSSLIYFAWDIYRDPPPQKKFQISKLIFDTRCGLEVQKPTQVLQLVKGLANTFD